MREIIGFRYALYYILKIYDKHALKENGQKC
ncbi:Uncharacterised protein [Legionella longbeachae]|nr:Uncharacterised protein [Legionella longbeachae]